MKLCLRRTPVLPDYESAMVALLATEKFLNLKKSYS